MADDDFEYDDLDDDGPPKVAQSEHDLIVMARALVMGAEGNEDLWSLLCASRAVPSKIGTTAAELLEETLAQAWRSIWLRGGTRPRTAHTGTKGRLWERVLPAPLVFTAATFELLRWLVQTPFAAPLSTIKPLPRSPLAIGDQLLVYFALDAARHTPGMRVLVAQPFVQASPLAWLGFSAQLVTAKDDVRSIPPPLGFSTLTSGAGAIVLEGLGDELAARWRQGELAKRSVVDPADLIRLGDAQDQVLASLLEQCDAAGRRDLAGFVIDALAPLVTTNAWAAPDQLDPTAPLSQRAEARTASSSLLRAVLRWNAWDEQHRGVRFFDDNYASSQVLLHRFERIGSAGVARVNEWLARLSALSPT